MDSVAMGRLVISRILKKSGINKSNESRLQTKMDRWKGRVAVVTGAAVGIGAAIADALVKNGMIVFGCDVQLDKLEELSKSLKKAKGKYYAVKCDVTNEEEILAMFADIKTKHGGVDVCINNAGVCPPSAELLSGQTDSWRKLMETNILALTICTREAVKSMTERNVDDGQIININSICAYDVLPLPDTHFYSATAFAMRALTKGVCKELRLKNSHIRIAEISPGVVKSEIHRSWRGEDGSKAFYDINASLQPKDIADTVVFVLSTPPHVQVQEIILSPTEAEVNS